MLRGADDVDAFTQTYGVPFPEPYAYGHVYEIRWQDVASAYQGIIIAPYVNSAVAAITLAQPAGGHTWGSRLMFEVLTPRIDGTHSQPPENGTVAH